MKWVRPRLRGRSGRFCDGGAFRLSGRRTGARIGDVVSGALVVGDGLALWAGTGTGAGATGQVLLGAVENTLELSDRRRGTLGVSGRRSETACLAAGGQAGSAGIRIDRLGPSGECGGSGRQLEWLHLQALGLWKMRSLHEGRMCREIANLRRVCRNGRDSVRSVRRRSADRKNRRRGLVVGQENSGSGG